MHQTVHLNQPLHLHSPSIVVFSALRRNERAEFVDRQGRAFNSRDRVAASTGQNTRSAVQHIQYVPRTYCTGSAGNVGWRQESDASCAYNFNVGAETRMRIISSVVYEVHDGGESCFHQREIPLPLGTIAPRQDNC
jgi:hypothetical protein